MTSFDPYDWTTNYFGHLERNNANEMLEHKEEGVFLVRDSSTEAGDFVLSVREKERVCHYLIKRVVGEGDGEEKYLIGEQIFPDVASLLNFYKTHYLETTPLRYPAPKKLNLVIAKYDFQPKESTDLGFKKGEKLWVIKKEGEWWTAKNCHDKTGQIPANYVNLVDEDALNCNNRVSAESYSGASGESGSSVSRPGSNSSGGGGGLSMTPPIFDSPHNSACAPTDHNNSTTAIQPGIDGAAPIQRKLPAWGVVIQDRNPNAYDRSALKLKKNDRIWVTKAPVGGTWEGVLSGKTGLFPYNYIRFVDQE